MVEDRPPQEAQLVARAKRGEPGAYEDIVRLHATIAFRTAWVITRSTADAEEAAQDAFVKAHAALGRFREGAPFRPWLLAIVANEARNRVRSAGRRAGLAQRVAEERVQVLAGNDGQPDHAREANACRYLLELSEEETAAALGCRRGTVKSRVSRALVRLRSELPEVEA
jgi:RNA polymerase sigma-70 factor (ECF subfamily)